LDAHVAAPEAHVAAPSRALAGYPAPLAPAARGACVLRGAWTIDQPRALRLADGKLFATARNVQRAELVLGEAPQAFVELASAPVRLWGFVEARAVTLHPATPFVVAGYAAPGPSAALRWLATRDQVVSFEVALPAHIKARRPPRGERPCAELAIDASAHFDPRTAIEADTASTAALPAKVAIPLALEPGRAPIATLRSPESEPRVDVLERRGEQARVAVLVDSLNPLDNVVVVGWVPASRLRPHTHGFGGSWGTGGGEPPARRLPPRRDTRFVTCSGEVPLVVELGAAQHLVGALAAGVVIEILPDPRGDLAEVRVAAANVELAPGARLLAKQAVLAGCASATGP
jgi:hypothetical protein